MKRASGLCLLALVALVAAWSDSECECPDGEMLVQLTGPITANKTVPSNRTSPKDVEVPEPEEDEFADHYELLGPEGKPNGKIKKPKDTYKPADPPRAMSSDSGDMACVCRRERRPINPIRCNKLGTDEEPDEACEPSGDIRINPIVGKPAVRLLGRMGIRARCGLWQVASPHEWRVKWGEMFVWTLSNATTVDSTHTGLTRIARGPTTVDFEVAVYDAKAADVVVELLQTAVEDGHFDRLLTARGFPRNATVVLLSMTARHIAEYNPTTSLHDLLRNPLPELHFRNNTRGTNSSWAAACRREKVPPPLPQSLPIPRFEREVTINSPTGPDARCDEPKDAKKLHVPPLNREKHAAMEAGAGHPELEPPPAHELSSTMREAHKQLEKSILDVEKEDVDEEWIRSEIQKLKGRLPALDARVASLQAELDRLLTKAPHM